MVYEAERLINRRFGRSFGRRWLIVASYIGAGLLGSAVTVAVAILIRKI